MSNLQIRIRKEGILVIGWGIRNILCITILIVIPWVLFTLSNVRNTLNSASEAQTRRLENFLINNYKSSQVRYGKGQKGIQVGHLYEYFFEEGHKRLEHVMVAITDKTDVSRPLESGVLGI